VTVQSRPVLTDVARRLHEGHETMTTDSDLPGDMKARLMALGQVIEWSAHMEYTVRNAFCSLVGSKYAAVVAGGQSASWLIDQCKALTDAHKDMPVDHRESIKAALERCRAINERRNHLVHGVKTASGASDGALQTMKSRLRTYAAIVEPWTPATIQKAAAELLHADLALFAAVQQAVSPEIMVIADTLGWEDHYRGQQQT
jgi:hypothetical protein